MRAIRTTTGIVVLGALALVGCRGKDVPAAKMDEEPVVTIKEGADLRKELFPMKLGNTWVFEIQGTRLRGSQRAARDSTVTYKVVKVSGTDATITVTDDRGREIDRQVWRNNDKGLYQVSISTNNVAFNPPQLIAEWPVKEGQTFKWKGSGILPTGVTGAQSTETLVLPKIVAQSPKGSFETFPYETKFTLGGQSAGTGTSTIFFAPGTGIIRYRQTVRTQTEVSDITMKLKDFTLK